MGYKVDFDEVNDVHKSVQQQCNSWLGTLESLQAKFEELVYSSNMIGTTATNIKNYIENIHMLLVGLLSQVISLHYQNCLLYKDDYQTNIDTDLHFVIHESELTDYKVRIENTNAKALEIDSSISYVLKQIKDIFYVSYSNASNVSNKHIAVSDYLVDLNEKIIALEKKHSENDFVNSGEMLRAILRLVDDMLLQNRDYKKDFSVEKIASSSLYKDLQNAYIVVSAEMEAKQPLLEEAINNQEEYLKKLEQEKEDREWIKWVAVGVAVVGSVVVTVVTVGGAAPLTVAACGAVVGTVTSASNKFAENYIENGDLVEGMDWKDFGKDVLVGAVGGFVGGYVSASTFGSAIKQPIKSGLIEMGNTVVTEAAEGAAGMAWETGETIYEVGEALVAGKTSDEIGSVLSDGLDEMGEEVVDTFKDVTVEGAKSFVGGTISGKFDIDTSEKGVLKKIGEKAAEGAAEGVTGGVVSTVWGVGEALVDNDSSTTIESALKAGAKETVQGVAKETVGAVVSEGVFSGVDNIDNKTGKIVMETVKDTTTDTVENVVEGVTGRTMDFVYGDEKDAGKILGDIWEEDLDSGRKIVQSAGESAGEHISNEVYKEDKHYNDLNKIDKDGDGKIEVVQFEDYAVTKQDYDVAVENAGKGAFKDKTVQDILGLPKDTDLDMRKERTVSIDMTEKYSPSRKTTDTVTIDGKYTFSKDYYESALNVAGTDEYGGKTVQEILEIPSDTDLSDNNITYQNRVDNDKIGAGKEVELHRNSGTNATKIHISSMKRETKIQREKNNK